jgi:signal transduction histidine kinase
MGQNDDSNSELQSQEIISFYQQLLERDISNYFTAIAHNLELIEKIAEKIEPAEYLLKHYQKAKRAVNSGLTIVNEVEKLQRIHFWKYEKLKLMDLEGIIQRAIKYHQNANLKAFKEKKLIIDFQFNPDQSYYVLANDLLDDFFITFIGNAIRKIKLIEEDLEIWKVIVEDRGKGISDEKKMGVFKRFSYDLDQPLGLSLAFELVKKMNGDLRVENRIPNDYTQGARFIIEIPKVTT